MFEGLPQWVWWLLTVYASLPLVCYLTVPFLFYGNRSTKKRIIICVLGDLGHSPRMCYHARSFSQQGWQVELCGYLEEQPPSDILEDTNITIHQLPAFQGRKGGSFLIKAVRKVSLQIYAILRLLWRLRGSDYFLLQNPPSIPILPMAAVYCTFSRCKLIIDWHNFGYSILKLKLGSFWHPLVLISFAVEYIFAKFAAYNLTVTRAMKDYLIHTFGLSKKRVAVLYDRPAFQFRPLKADRQAALQQDFIKPFIPGDFNISKGDRIIVTSTSFTPDEDLSILIGALKIYENSCEKFDDKLPKILCFVTGKGPLKQHFIDKVAETKWDRVHIEFLWLSNEDYPKLLQLCDYGVSLHTSSSGLDLPMKILDMFGSGIPVVSYNYPVLNELVQHNVNGLKFLDRRELHEALIFIMKDSHVSEVLKAGALKESNNRWQDSWEKAMEEISVIRR
ncbi:chitobiosyldiphosphodolichol beta-1,4 mannosyltransferase [Lachancea thermotolerans CBS 6340]|uniref:Chitobiosyldiphosphodolichol beta-mannosyltransferase n=1 Tax=Lachancea thermotolerans (strain ATCC 56472 / CBS 6340 / NRRL Y-8284) TaxID=559295 RepID=C5DL74_LACTC|nr:KLTH0F10604p [Lachancea thermotolerans CBS 6340]CAR24225.1 KLTH0F10604p [Lachancea thermotolerans CBS 6340]